jgi:hypothetical protein
MRSLLVLLVVAPFFAPVAALAQRSPVLVELFTSQGCSSCPPADAFLAELVDRPDVIALALHVTIWDYLGWQDRFGREEHDRRQKGYAKRARERALYTPQMVVQGQDRLIGSDVAAVNAAIEAHQALPPRVDLDLGREGDTLTISLSPIGLGGVGPSELYLAEILDSETVAIEGGENVGHTIDYRNVVTDWTRIATWDGAGPAEIEIDLDGAQSVAVILQQERLGPVVSAARLP